MKTPFLDRLIQDLQNHIEFLRDAESYEAIPEIVEELAEYEAIKALPKEETKCSGCNEHYTLPPQFLNDIIKYIEKTEVTIDGEWGDGRTLEELIADKEMPKLYHDLIDLKMTEFSTTSTKFHVSSGSWVMDCPALKIKDMPLCPASYQKHNLLAIARDTIKAKQKHKAYPSILAELSEAYSQSIRETL